MKKAINWLMTFELIIVICLFAINMVPMLFGIKPFIVMSGSMETEIHTGAVAFVDTNIKSDEIKKNDIIAFNIGGTLITHRAIEVNKEDKTFTTKGDANKTEDIAPVPFDNYIGKTIFSIPNLGFIFQWISSMKNKMFLIVLFIIQWLILEILETKEEIKDDEKEKY